MTGLWQTAGLGALSVGAATWLVVVLAAPHLRLITGRARGARAWLWAPFWVPVVVLTGALLRGLWPATDHCLSATAGHHHHLCLVHPPHPTDGLVGWLPTAAVGFALLLVGWRWSKGAARRRAAQLLVDTARSSSLGPDVRELDVPEAVGFAAHGAVVVSRGLLDGLSPRAVDVVLAHERAHLRGRHPTHNALDRFAAGLLPRRAAGPLLQHVMVAREIACDRAAAAQAGGPLAVAQALAELLRLETSAPAGTCGAATAVTLRAQVLLQPTVARVRPWLPLAACALLALGAGPAHALLERLVTPWLH